MALYFDLSLPYLHHRCPAADTKSLRDARLRSSVKLLELGYSGAAYDLPFRGVFSDKDRCSIIPFPISSFLSAAPSIAASASFHRRLLRSGDPYAASSFRQFSRVTVSIDSSSSAGSIGSTNPVIRSYDIVAIRPLNQAAFDHVCKFSEVDLISIDFSQKIPFRLRLQSVEAAIKRGLFFEITYSHLLGENPNLKRQMLSDAKMLVDWTRGKNLIVSSGATTPNEIRGPIDVMNLVSLLLGISTERAKSSISDNCRLLLSKALRKKNFYKETIRIERIQPNESESNSEETFSVRDWIDKWDPISSGDGDLPSLEQIAKLESGNKKSTVSKNRINFDFDSIGKPFSFNKLDDTGEINKKSINKNENYFVNQEETETAGSDSKSQREEMETKKFDSELHGEEMETVISDSKLCLDKTEANVSDSNSNGEQTETTVSNSKLDREEMEKVVSDSISDLMQLDQDATVKVCNSENDETVPVSDSYLKKDKVEIKSPKGIKQLDYSVPLKVCESRNYKNAPVLEECDGRVGIDAPMKECDLENDENALGKDDNTPLPNSCVDGVRNERGEERESTAFKDDNKEREEAKGGEIYIESGKRERSKLKYPAYTFPLKGMLKPMLFKKKSRHVQRRSRK